MNYEEGL